MGDYAASLQAVALRVSRVGTDGGPVPGPRNSYVTDSFTRAAFTPEYEAGEEFTQKNAAGRMCVNYKDKDTFKQANLEIAICAPEPDLYGLLGGGSTFYATSSRTITNKALATNVATLTTSVAHGFSVGNTVTVSGVDATFDGTYLISAVPTATTFTYAKTAANVTSASATGTAVSATGTDSIGWGSPAPGDEIGEEGLAIEVWSRAIVNGRPAVNRPYFHWLWPYATLRLEGERALENGLMAHVFSGHSVGNADWAPGLPTNAWPVDTKSAVGFVRTDSVPNVTNGWVTVAA